MEPNVIGHFDGKFRFLPYTELHHGSNIRAVLRAGFAHNLESDVCLCSPVPQSTPPKKAHDDLPLAKRKSRLEKYIRGGRILSDWNVWVALETYLQLQEKFGWDAFKKVFAAYHHMSDFPDENTAKMNLYAETFSHTVGMNLTGFFKAWGWPIETATEKKLSSLPPWSDHPMTQYD